MRERGVEQRKSLLVTLSLPKDSLSTYLVSEQSGYFIPPRSRIRLLEDGFAHTENHQYQTWTEVSIKLFSLNLGHDARPQLLLNRLPREVPSKKRARGKDKEAVQINTKTILCSKAGPEEYAGFIPPGKYHSIELSFGNSGVSFAGAEVTSTTSNKIIASRDFTSSAVRRAVAMFYSPNPETVRRLKKTASSMLSLLNSLKDDLIGVKPPEEIPDGPYGLEEYETWYSKNCSIGAREEVFASYFISTFPTRPLISVVLGVRDADPLLLAGTVHSILDQLYDRFELVVADAGSVSEETLAYLKVLDTVDPRIKVLLSEKRRSMSEALSEAISSTQGDFTVFVSQEDLLNRDALFWMVEKINEHPQTTIIYSDEDAIDLDNSHVLPHFKPDWNLLLLTSYNYIGHFFLTSTKLAKTLKLRGEASEARFHDFLLRAALEIDESSIKHIPRVLYHQRLPSDILNTRLAHEARSEEGTDRALKDFLASWSPGATVEKSKDFAFPRIHFPVPDPAPEVAIVIPTRDAPEVLERCVNSLVHFTKYSNYRLHVIDNQSSEARTVALFNELKNLHRVEVHHYNKPFNYSDMHNWLISQLDSELVCLLNNDTEIVDENWLTELVSLASLPNFAAAGSLLFYPDRTIQHAGVTLGIGGIAAHIGVGDPPDEPGYFSRNHLPQELSAVTAACLVVKRELYELVGGMNSERLPVSFNDVDLCLKLRSRGHKIAWTPNSQLIHHESKSRGQDYADEFKKLRAAGEMSYCALTWRSEIINDPYYNPNFDLEYDPFQMLASLPRLELTLKPYNKT